MCLYPTLRQNPKYKKNKKNGGRIPPLIDIRVLFVPTGCGNCIECRTQKARDWQVRMTEDLKEHKNGKFVMLSFSNENITKLYNEIENKIGYDKDNEVAKLAVRRFCERWRKKHKKSIRHWLITELGHVNTEHLHMHGIIWTDETNEEIQNKWMYGKVWFGTYVNIKTINYTIKYFTKIDKDHKYYRPIILTSAGIGSNYFNRKDQLNNKYQEQGTKETYTLPNGQETALPQYYRNKLYKDDEKEKLWIEKLNKQKRYILGKEIDISKGEEEYNKLLKIAQMKNTQWGYGTNKEDWTQKEYEQQRRALKQAERKPKG